MKTRFIRVNTVLSYFVLDGEPTDTKIESVSTIPDECKGVDWILSPIEAQGFSTQGGKNGTYI